MDTSTFTDQLVALDQARADAATHLDILRIAKRLDQRWRNRAIGDVRELGRAITRLAAACGIELPAPKAVDFPEGLGESEAVLLLADLLDADRAALVVPSLDDQDDPVLSAASADVASRAKTARDGLFLVVNHSTAQAGQVCRRMRGSRRPARDDPRPLGP